MADTSEPATSSPSDVDRKSKPRTRRSGQGEPRAKARRLINPESFGVERFINRETSWLEFNKRVLEEAENPRHPLWERVRFLAISGSNLDEFYMVRAAGLRGMIRNGVAERSMDGLTPREQLRAINTQTHRLFIAQHAIWNQLHAEMRAEGYSLVAADELSKSERRWLADHFRNHIWPLLTPTALDPAYPFPFVPNLGFGVAAQMVSRTGETLNAIVLIPRGAPRFITLPRRANGARNAGKVRFVAIETLITEFLDTLFPGYKPQASGVFRIIRDSDIEIQEEAEDLVAFFETALKKRDKGALVRLKINEDMPEDLRAVISEGLEAQPEDIALVDGILGIKDLSKLIQDDRPELLFPRFTPRSPERIREFQGDIFAAVRAKDIVIHHPYESFDTVVQFLRQAARDPQVRAIKQTLYRTSHGSPIVDALCEAAEAGKNVTAIVELKARFDEEHNLNVARDLEKAGVQVGYGFMSYKTHAKLSLVVREEGDVTRAYTHVGTGNYHPQTAKVYTDVSLLTADPDMARDAGKVFNYITSYAPPQDLARLSVSPQTLKSKLIKLIRKEASNAQAGQPSGIWAKMNSLVHPQIIDALYQASQAGVPVELVVRGICCLRPGVAGLSENIRVKSIVGRYLEHSRIYCFANGASMPSLENRVYISSADLMPRNLDRRVEVMAPLETATVREHVLDQIMHANINDECQSWYLKPDATYSRVDISELETPFCAHEYFMTYPSLSGRGDAGEETAPPRFERLGPRNLP